MKRYTVYDANLGRYVLPISGEHRKEDPPHAVMVKRETDSPLITLFGEAIDHLAQLEIAAEDEEKRREAQGHWTRTDEHTERHDYLYECSCCLRLVLGTPDYCPACGAYMRGEGKP